MSKKSEYEKRTERLIAPILERDGLRLYDIEYVKEARDFFLRVFIDKPGGVTIDDCVEVSRTMNEILDKEDYIEDAYTFEVSSPGIERVLRKEWHYKEAVGSDIVVKCYRAVNGKKEFEGRLLSYEKDTLEVETDEGVIVLKSSDIAIAKMAFK